MLISTCCSYTSHTAYDICPDGKEHTDWEVIDDEEWQLREEAENQNAVLSTNKTINTMLVEIKEKSVYGGTLLYPNNQTAVYLTELMNKKTFNIRDLDIITDLGFTINIIKL